MKVMRTVEIRPASHAQGYLIEGGPDANGNHSVLCEGSVKTGKLIEPVKPCDKVGKVYE